MAYRRLLVILLTLGALPLVAGCQLHANMDVRLERDGSATVTYTLEMDESLRADAHRRGFDLVDYIYQSADLDGWEVHASETRVQVSTTVDDVGELSATTAAFADAIASPEMRPLDPVEVWIDDDVMGVRGRAGLLPVAAVPEVGLEPAEAITLLGDAVTYTISLQLPGEVVGHNADRMEGERLVWDVPTGGQVTFEALAQLPPDRPGIRIAALVGLPVLLALAVVVLARSRRMR